MPAVVTGAGLAVAGVAGIGGLLGPARAEPAEPVDPAARLGRRGLRYKDRATRLALCAAADAVRSGGLIAADGTLTVAGDSVAVVASSNLGNLDTVCQVAATLAEQASDGLSPMDLPNASSNVIASSVALEYGLRGPNLMLCNGPASGLDAVYWAGLLLAAGRCARALVIGAEPGNAVVERLSGTPGAQLFDGAVALVLERADAAAERGAAPLARLGCYARETGLARCVRRLLAGEAGPPGLWLTSGRPGGQPGPAGIAGPAEMAGLAGVAGHDLTSTFGQASGALGVLQCAAAAGWFCAGGTSAALLTSDAEASDGVCGLLLRPDKEHVQ
jgi:3-oxoacyl-[acyl-carrier-protein] synthase II